MIKGKIGIVIVNYNGKNYQNEALRSITESSYQNFEIVVVDSGSNDDSIVSAKEEFPQVHYLIQDENVGVAKGNNIGIEYSINQLDAEYVLLINNDIVIEKNTIEILVNNADNATVTVPKIYYYDPSNVLWFGGGKLSWRKAEGIHIGIDKKDCELYNKMEYIDYSPTCCMLLHRDIIQHVGKIDELMFMYFDDTDLCVRLIENGYRIAYVPSALLWHKVSSSSGGGYSKVFVYYNYRNKLYFMDKHKEKILFPAKLYTVLKMVVKFLISPIYKKNDKYLLKAWKDYKNKKMGRCDEL